MSCVKACLEDFLGDGYCDPINNQKHCHWDKGDCCASTMEGRVKPFPHTCTDECECKDPDAVENKPGDRGEDDEDDDDDSESSGSGKDSEMVKVPGRV